MDSVWWDRYHVETKQEFRGARYSVNDLDKQYGVVHIPKPFTSHGNSGAGAIAMAALGGAKRIILLGYDLQHTDGKRHWHGNHPRWVYIPGKSPVEMGNADMVDRWPTQFAKMAETLPAGIEVINCTRQTALTQFKTAKLEAVL